MHQAAPSPLVARRSGPLKGSVRVPGDKSISHRAALLAAMSDGVGLRASTLQTASLSEYRTRRQLSRILGAVTSK